MNEACAPAVAPGRPAHEAPAEGGVSGSGHGDLVVERTALRSVLRRARAESPLRFLSPKNHGDAAWVYLSTFGGGLVEGDTVTLDVMVAHDASLLLGTQASTKVYRCSTRTSRHVLRARVQDGGLFVSIPDAVQCYAGARYVENVEIDLDGSASLVLAATFTAGRSARGERWDFARIDARNLVRRDGKPLILDTLLLDSAHGRLRDRMGRFDALTTVVAVGPRAKPVLDAILAQTPVAIGRDSTLLESVSRIGDDALVVRIAATDAQVAARRVRELLVSLPDLLGDDPFARKW